MELIKFTIAVRKVVQKLRKGGIKIGNNIAITIQNIVASVSLGGKVHLENTIRKFSRESCSIN